MKTFFLSIFYQILSGAPALKLSADTSTVTFEDVMFQYTEGRKILNKMSFTIPAGKKIAIVGGSGSGLVML